MQDAGQCHELKGMTVQCHTTNCCYTTWAVVVSVLMLSGLEGGGLTISVIDSYGTTAAKLVELFVLSLRRFA